MSEQLKRMRIHLLVPNPDGPIHSGPAEGNIPVGTRSRWAFACAYGSPATLGDLDRGTTEPWAVRCDACKATAHFKAIDRPKPSAGGPAAAQLVATGEEGCCG